jgi:translation initiation factor 2B subunit (eIF-2B alpha/beta/delta family)
LFDAHLAETKAQIAVECQMMIDKLRSELDESFRSRASALLSDVQQVCQKQVDHDVGAMVKAFVSMKEQMKKMAEQNATPMDLIEFMEQSYTQLQIPSRPPAEDGWM